MGKSGSHANTGVVGLLGGTFDPVHRAHLALAEAALASGTVDVLRLIPAGRPPHRAPPFASGNDRLAMARLALAELPEAMRLRCEIDAGEVECTAPSYTIDTLERLRRELGPARPLALVLGADAFLGLPTWHRWADLLPNAHLLVTGRHGHRFEPDHLPEALRPLWRARLRSDPMALAGQPAGLIHVFAMPATDISATTVRALLAAGDFEAAEKLVPAAVLRYIRSHHLYRELHGYADPAENRH